MNNFIKEKDVIMYPNYNQPSYLYHNKQKKLLHCFYRCMLHLQNSAIVVQIKSEELQNLEGMHTKGFLKRCVDHPPTFAAPQSTPHRYDIFKIIVSYMLRTIIPVGFVPPASAKLGGISFVC